MNAPTTPPSPGSKALRFALWLTALGCLLVAAAMAMVVLATIADAERLTGGTKLEATVLRTVTRDPRRADITRLLAKHGLAPQPPPAPRAPAPLEQLTLPFG